MEWTGAKYADTPTVEAETWVDAPPERVWEVVADIEQMPTMSAELQSVQWLDDARGPAPGARFVGQNTHPAMGEWSTTSHVVECAAPRVLAWAVQDPQRPSAIWRFTLEPAGEGTRLHQWMQMGPASSGLSVALAAMPEQEEKIVFVRLRELEQAIITTLSAIKQRVEGG